MNRMDPDLPPGADWNLLRLTRFRLEPLLRQPHIPCCRRGTTLMDKDVLRTFIDSHPSSIDKVDPPFLKPGSP